MRCNRGRHELSNAGSTAALRLKISELQLFSAWFFKNCDLMVRVLPIGNFWWHDKIEDVTSFPTPFQRPLYDVRQASYSCFSALIFEKRELAVRVLLIGNFWWHDKIEDVTSFPTPFQPPLYDVRRASYSRFFFWVLGYCSARNSNDFVAPTFTTASPEPKLSNDTKIAALRLTNAEIWERD